MIRRPHRTLVDVATALITVEGVLAASRTLSEPIVTSQPIGDGVKLYHALKSVWRLVLITAETDGAMVEHWCMQQGLTEHALLAVTAAQEPRTALEDATLRHLGQQRSWGTVGLLVTPSPAAAAATMQMGVSTILFCPPNYARPEFRPDYEKTPRPWEDIEIEMTKQRVLKARDPRLETQR